MNAADKFALMFEVGPSAPFHSRHLSQLTEGVSGGGELAVGLAVGASGAR